MHNIIGGEAVACANLSAESGKEIGEYWEGRAQSYSNGVVGELGDERRESWERVVDRLVYSVFADAELSGHVPRVLDLGCGPGFFCVLFAERGCQVDGVDASPGMLAQAAANLSDHPHIGQVTLHQCDVTSLPFSDNVFDLAIARNVTWLMLDPEATYAEWLRVLAPGGKLLVFDGNWYRYLVDDGIAAQRAADQEGNRLEGWDDDAQSTSAGEKRFEKLAAQLPLTPVLRPQWDEEVLMRLGASSVRSDCDIYKRLWTENEQSYYASSPMFLVEAVK